MQDIHASAIVHPRAELGRDVVVGPFSIVGPDVRIGDRTWIGAHAVVEGRTTIGDDCRIFHGAVLGAVPQDLKYRDEVTYVRIGAGTTIREYATVHLACVDGEATEVGDGCLLMAYVHVAHNCKVGSNVILANAVTLAGHVQVHDFASVGGLTPVHQFARIGAYAFVGGASRVSKDVPPFVKCAGSPLELIGINSIGLERRGFDEERRTLLKRAYRVLFRSGLNTHQALERLRAEFDTTQEDLQTLIRFIETSDRGVHI